MRTAWAESPSLAVHLASRFPYPRIVKEVRWLLLNFPSKAAHEPEALPILIDGSLPDDVGPQLKVSLPLYIGLPLRAVSWSPFLLTWHLVPSILGSGQSTYCSDFVLASLPEPSVPDPVRYAGA